jgi:phenylpropionate dioxygenase-like ring-hydroxylating dioxygenase large terminal subunit
MRFLRNTWYVAAWDDELKPGAMTHRTILNEGLVLLRGTEGKAYALQDRCPHRFAPLHLGVFDGTTLQCGYHGLKFNGLGACVQSPYGTPPKAAKVRSYPLAEMNSMLWIWMGDPALADEKLIPDFGFQNPNEFFVGKEYLHVRSNYCLEIENILDLSHTEFMHAATLGSSGISKARYESKQEGETIWSNRLTSAEIMNDELCDAMGVPRHAPVDRWINVRWNAAANMAIFAGAVPTGRPHSEGRETPTAHCFTPETDTTTHYWFGISFPKALGDIGSRMARDQIKYVRAPFELEDLPMLEKQQRNIGSSDFWDLKPVLLPGDAAGVRARRMLEKLLVQEGNGDAPEMTPAGAARERIPDEALGSPG